MHKKPWFRKRFQKHLTPEIEGLMDQLESHYVVSPTIAFVIVLVPLPIFLYESHQPPSFLRTAINVTVDSVMLIYSYLSFCHVTSWKNGFPPKTSRRRPDVVYTCRNRMTAPTYLVQVGWTKQGRRIMQEHPDIFAAKGITCRYKDEHPDDPVCRGCRHGQADKSIEGGEEGS